MQLRVGACRGGSRPLELRACIGFRATAGATHRHPRVGATNTLTDDRTLWGSSLAEAHTCQPTHAQHSACSTNTCAPLHSQWGAARAARRVRCQDATRAHTQHTSQLPCAQNHPQEHMHVVGCADTKPHASRRQSTTALSRRGAAVCTRQHSCLP